MASFGRTLVRGLGAALQGYGAGMIAQAQVDEQRRVEAAREQREIALANLRFELGERAADAESKRAVGRAESGAQIAVGQHAATRRIDEGYQVEREQRQEGREAREAERQLANAERLARLNSQLRMSESAAAAATELNNRLTLEGQTVNRYETTTDGRIVALNGRGQILGQTAAGMVAPDTPRGGSSRAPTGGQAPQTRVLRYDAEGRRIGG